MEDDERQAARRQLLETPAAELAARRAEIQAQAESAGFSAKETRGILNSRTDPPRPLLPEERDALLLSFMRLDGPAREALHAQVAAAKVSGYDCECPCASVALVVDKTTAPPASITTDDSFGSVSIYDADGEFIGGVHVGINDGYLTDIEIWWLHEPISPIPPRGQLVVEPPTNS